MFFVKISILFIWLGNGFLSVSVGINNVLFFYIILVSVKYINLVRYSIYCGGFLRRENNLEKNKEDVVGIGS